MHITSSQWWPRTVSIKMSVYNPTLHIKFGKVCMYMVGLYWTASEAIETTFTIIICTVNCFHARTCKLYQICFPHQFYSSTSMMTTADRLPASLLSSSTPYPMLWVLHEPLKTCSSPTCSLDMYEPHTHRHSSPSFGRCHHREQPWDPMRLQ